MILLHEIHKPKTTAGRILHELHSIHPPCLQQPEYTSEPKDVDQQQNAIDE